MWRFSKIAIGALLSTAFVAKDRLLIYLNNDFIVFIKKRIFENHKNE